MENETIEIDIPKEETVVRVTPVTEAVEAGFSEKEIEAGKKAGLLHEETPDEKKKAAEEAEAKAASEKEKAEAEAAEKAGKDNQEPVEGQDDLTKFNANEKALYWKQKKEKQARQKAEAERDQARIREAYWKGKAEEAGKKPALEVIDPKKKTDDESFLEEFGEDPNKNVDDKDKPLTRADLDKIEADKQAKEKELREKHDERVKATLSTLREQELSFKEVHEDYDQVFERTKEILDIAHDEKKLAELFPDRLQRRAVKSMAQELVAKMVAPDKVPAGDAIAPELAYELGKLHPKASTAGDDGESGNKDEGDKALKQRLDKQGRPSSAPLGSGGTTTIKTVEDLTMEDLATMSEAKFAALKKKHPKVVERILRESD